MKFFWGQKQLRSGQLVEVLSESQILATLDADGKLDGVPFMPEMARFCGRRLRVFRRADKTCVEGYGIRQMRSTVFLEEVRCDGAAHDGCQRNCLVFWKEAWLKPVDRNARNVLIDPPPTAEVQHSAHLRTRQEDRYFCQSTELAGATTPLSPWNVTHFLRDMLQGELALGRFLHIVGRMAWNRVRMLFGWRKIGASAGAQTRTLLGTLNLQKGESVQVKSPEEICTTLNADGRNRGLTFEPDMLMFCGSHQEIDFPIERIISEETGKMVVLNNTVALKGVNCQGFCAKNCPRSNPLYWRESWLQREPAPPTSPPPPAVIEPDRELIHEKLPTVEITI